MKTPKNHSSKGIRPSTLFQLGLLTAMGITLVGFEFSTVDIERGSAVTSKMSANEIEMVPEVEVEKPELKEEHKPRTENTEKIENANTSIQQMNTNIVTTENKNEVTENVGFSEGDTAVIVDFEIKDDEKIDLTDEIFVRVQHMPTYEDLLTESDDEIRRQLTDKKMLSIVYSTIKYPAIPLQQGIEGKVHVSFVVDKTGEITNVTVERGAHPDLDAEAVRAVKSLPTMIPGKQRDKEVKVRFYLPIEFRIKK